MGSQCRGSRIGLIRGFQQEIRALSKDTGPGCNEGELGRIFGIQTAKDEYEAGNTGFRLQKIGIRPEIRGSQGGPGSGYRERDSGKKNRIRSRKLEVLSTHGARPYMGPAQNRTRPSGSGPAAALPQALRLLPARPSQGRSGLTHPQPTRRGVRA